MKVFVCGSADKNINPKYIEGVDKIAENLNAHNDGIICVGTSVGAVGAIYKKVIEGDGFVDIIVPTAYANEAEGMIANSITQVDTLFMLQQVALRNSRVTLVLPGGNGTLAELYMITDSIKSKFDTDLVIIYNINGYYDKLKEMNQFMINAGTMKGFQNNFFKWCDTPEEVVDELDKWRDKIANEKTKFN